MTAVFVTSSQLFTTIIALILGFVAFHVECQVVGAGKASLTHSALEWFGTSVFTNMPGQLVRAGKPPTTRLKVALVWLLTYR